jgi:hypothetical protein
MLAHATVDKMTVMHLTAMVLAPTLCDISPLDFFAAGLDGAGRMSRDAPRRRSILY